MQIGAAMFFTDYSMTSAALARELEARGFESVWAPEHSHVPLSRQSPFPSGGELPKQYYDAMDPFVTLAAAAAATRTIKIGTGVCLVIQRDTIQTAKLVASLNQVSGGRFLFGVGGGWNAEEMADHGTVFKSRFKLMRERIEAMKEIWTKDAAEYHGDMVDFGPMIDAPETGSETASAGHRRRHVPAGGAPRAALRRRLDPASAAAAIRGRHRLPAAVPPDGDGGRTRSGERAHHRLGRAARLDRLRRYRDQGIARGVVQLAPEPAAKTLPILDRWADLIRQIGELNSAVREGARDGRPGGRVACRETVFGGLRDGVPPAAACAACRGRRAAGRRCRAPDRTSNARSSRAATGHSHRLP